MATNPMKRKARNSFLLGMLLMLVISGIIIVILAMQLINRIKEKNEEIAASVKVYVLNQDVSSGQVITEDMLKTQIINRNLVPSNAVGDISVISNYSLQDKEGNNVYTKTENGQAKLYIKIASRNNREFELNLSDNGNYYIEDGGENVFIDLNNIPLVAKVNMKSNTLVTTELLSKSDNVVRDDVRKQEYNMLVLPTDLVTGDYIDIRLMLPSGQDFIVVSKKEVELPSVDGVESEDTIWINLTEDEILHMSCAIVDTFQRNGTKLYATKYTEAGMQKAATVTYPLNRSTLDILANDPNIVDKAMDAITQRYNNSDMTSLRNNINSVIEQQGDQSDTNLQSNMQESITNSKNSRREYLDSLAGVIQ